MSHRTWRTVAIAAVIGAASLTGAGFGIAHSLAPASPPPSLSNQVDKPEAGDTPDATGTVDKPEAGDTPDSPAATDTPEPGDTPDAPGQH
ncbi:hypothetical protein [Williamsia deligens]|uniref:Uncharacterized protein n=1 Tax=Williamsia deligens TaxID=321325 RepID=A0ABW3G7J2_9NOCA|nr:hypothetical protein [Williamsia deligens]MCP2192548.1 hypothetical protein [Williamsia deligens]